VTWLDAARPAGTEEPVGEIIKWFDHDDHRRFDVCADDHCQRYQGLTLAVGEKVRAAIDETWGLVLRSGGELVDARFYKCCGGRTERFSTAWADVDYPYLPVHDDPWCDTHDKEILGQVLNDYDLETKDFHDWTVRYKRAELSALIAKRSGVDIGDLVALEPLERGGSGRIKLLRVVGSKTTFTVGKELMIRRILSESHLYSSWFDVEMTDDEVILRGHGWGHGVGLCQIGAAVMAAQGKTFEEILSFYYPGTTLER
jgi:SpoIID/LytB domain protein